MPIWLGVCSLDAPMAASSVPGRHSRPAPGALLNLVLFMLGFAEILKATIWAEVGDARRGGNLLQTPWVFPDGITVFGTYYPPT